MTKEEFLRRLEYELRSLPKDECENAMQYYRDYLNDADDVQAAIDSLGSPQKVASDILKEVGTVPTQGNTGHSRRNTLRSRWDGMDNGQRILMIVLVAVAAVCAIPVLIGTGGGLIGILIAIVAVIFCAFLVFLCLAFGFVIAAVACMFSIFYAPSLASVLILLGSMMTFSALAILSFEAFLFMFRTLFHMKEGK